MIKANGTSIGSYYNAGANDITSGYGGTVNSSGGGVRNSNTGSMGIKEIAAAHARKNLDEWIASGQSIANTYQQDPSAYSAAAAFREAGALMTSQSIEAKGGLKSAINQGIMNAASEGSAEKAGFVGRATQQLVSQGMNAEDAKKMADSIANGSERGAEKFKQAIMSASGAAAITNASEQEGMSQAHSKKLKEEFGETLTEKKSVASGKTFTEEHEALSSDAQSQKKLQWEKRKEALQKRRDQMALYTKGDNVVAASHVQSVLNSVIEKDPSLNDTGRTMAMQEVSSLSKRIQNGEEVTTKDIKKALGDSLGGRAIDALESNGVDFEDAKGLGTGDAINVKTTGSSIKQHMANAVVVGALQAQDKTNQQLLASGEISQKEFGERREKLGYLMKGASGENGGSMPFEYFKDAGFTQERLDKLGIKEGKTEHANMTDRMFQVSHIDSNSVLSAAVKSIDSEINKEMPKETAKTTSKTPPKSQRESEAHSWNELANAQEGKRVKEFVGSGSGIIENTAKNADTYSENAMYGEMSRASTTQAKIEAQGGIHKAVAVDSAESTIKAATQKGAVSEQAAQLAGGGEDGKKIAEAIKNGSAEGADLLAAGIVRAAQDLGAAQSGARTASDIEAVSAHGGKEQYIADKASASTFKETSEAKQAQIYDDQEMMNKRVAGYLKNYGGAAREERVQNLVEQGILEEGSTGESFQATTGKKARRAWAEAGAGAMNRDTNVMLSGERVNLSQDMATGKTLANIDGSTREAQGHSYETNAAWRAAEKLFPDDIEAQKAYVEGQQMSKEVARNWGTGALSAASVKILEGMGVEPTDENREMMQDVLMGMGGAAAAATGAGVTEAAQRYNNAKNGKFTAKEDFTYTDSNGKSREIKAGTNLDIPQNELGSFREQYGDKVEVRKGKVGEFLSNSKEKMRSSFEKLSPFSGEEKTLKSTNESSNYNSQNNSSQSSGDKPKHNNSLLNEILQGSDGSLPNGNSDYSTKEGLSRAKENLLGSKSEEIGRISLKNSAKQTSSSAKAELEEAALAGDDAKVKKASAKLGAANKILSDLDDGLDVDVKDVKRAGISMPHTKTKQVTPSFSKEVVNFDSLGEEVKAVEGAKIDNAIKSVGTQEVSNTKSQSQPNGSSSSDLRSAPEHTPHTGDMPAPKTRAGKVMAWALGLAGAGALFSSQADAKEMPARPVLPEDGTATVPVANADTAGLAMQAAFNGVNAVGAAMEMKSGASTNVMDLAKGSSYKEGFKAIAKDAVDVSDFKGLAASFADEGAVEGMKMGGKALGKSAMKKLPLVGVAAGAAFAYDRAQDGDFIGAAMEFASGAASMIPGIGTAASVAIDTALMKRDYDAAHQEPARTPAGQIEAANRQLQPMSNQEAGLSYIESVTPSQSRPAVAKAAQSGTLTKEQMSAAGTPSDIVERMPVNENGSVDVETSGSMYKQGMAQMEAVTQMPNHPTFKYSGNLN